MFVKRLNCLRCAVEMEYAGRYEFQLGQEGRHTRLVAALLSESLEMGIYKCPKCQKLEFYELDQ